MMRHVTAVLNDFFFDAWPPETRGTALPEDLLRGRHRPEFWTGEQLRLDDEWARSGS